MSDALFTMQNIIGAGMTGIMGILWLDIRKFRKDIDNRLHEKLDSTTHNLLCENATLKIREHLDTRLDDMALDRKRDMNDLKAELLAAIKNNGHSK